MKPNLRHAMEKLSLYLPVLLMGLLALGTWWLVRNAPKPIAVGPERAVMHEPDYYMKDFSIKSFDVTGRLKSRSYEARDGSRRTVLEVEVDEVGPSLRYATATVTRTQSGQRPQQTQQTPVRDPWASDGTEAPF